MYLAVTRRRQGCHGATVKAAVHDDNRRRLDAFVVALESRQFDGGFVGFCTGVTEERVVHAGTFAQAVGQLGLQRNLVQVGGMQQRLRLMGQRFGHMRVGMAQTADGDTGQTVEVGFTLAVGQVGAGAADKIHGHTAIGIHNMVLHGPLSCTALQWRRVVLRKIPHGSTSKDIEKPSS